MLRFLLGRLASAIIVMFGVSVVTFLVFQAIPNGDPAIRMAGRMASPETIERIQAEWGFDRPLPVQYFRMMSNIFSGQVYSYNEQVNVLDQIVRGLPATVSLAVGGALLWALLSVGLGLLGAVMAGHAIDRLLTAFAIVGISMPAFLLGALGLYFFAFEWRIFPSGGYAPLSEGVWRWAYHLVLPWLTLALIAAGIYSRLLRAELLERFNDDYIRTARAKGISEGQVLFRHALRNAIMPIVSLWGLDFAATVGGGAILIETVFNLHGVGQYAARSIGTLDVPPVMVIVMFASVLVVLVGMVTDTILAFLDPRIRIAK